MAYYCPRYYHYYDPIVVKGYQEEYWRMRDGLRHQQSTVDHMIDQVREERRKAIDITTIKCNSLTTKVNYDSRRIDSLESDLATWKARFSEMSGRFDTMKSTLERKDITMDRMRDDLNKCSSTVSDVVAKSKRAQDEYTKLAGELRWKQVRADMDAREARDAAATTMKHLNRFRVLDTYRSVEPYRAVPLYNDTYSSIYDDLYLYY